MDGHRERVIELANLTAASKRQHKERDPRAAVNRILTDARIPVTDSIRKEILSELGRRGGKTAARNRQLGRPPQDTSEQFPTSLFGRRDRERRQS